MRLKRNGKIIRLLCAVAAVCLLAAALAGCNSDKSRDVKREVLLEDGGVSLDVWFYELLLSRMKAELARQKNDVNSEDFWNQTVTTEGGENLTRSESCERSVLESAKKYLAGIKLAKEQGIELSKDYFDGIDEKINFYLDYDAENDMKAFNKLLGQFGVDASALKSAYEYEYLISLIQIYLYGSGGELISSNVKEDFFEKNYYRYKQIFIPSYHYEYVKDEFGQVVYFNTETGYIAYDTENGHIEYTEGGNEMTDSQGKPVYYSSEFLPLYDTENGEPQYETDGDGYAVKYSYSSSELEEIEAEAEEIYNSLTPGSYAAFDEKVDEYDNTGEGRSMFSGGYYVSRIESENFTGDFFVELVSKLEEMNEGDITRIKNGDGCYIIMKYPPVEGDYAKTEYELLFTNFIPSLITDLFDNKCKQEIANITVNENALKSAKGIREIGINYYY